MPSDDVSSPDGRFRATSEPPPFRHLIGLKVEHRANRIDSVVPLRLTLTADSHELEVPPPPGNAFKRVTAWFRPRPSAPLKLLIRLRSVYVRYILENCAITESSKYSRLVDEGDYAASATTQTKSVTSSDLSGKASASFAATPSSFEPKIALGAGAAAKTAENHTTTTKLSQSIEVAAVLPVVEGWRIGDPDLGDPTKRDGCLTGQYLAAPGERDTCNVVLEAELATATFEVTVRDRGIDVARADRSATSDEREAALTNMRNRLAAIAVEKALDKSRNDPSGEHLLFAVTCTIERAPDLPDLPALPPIADNAPSAAGRKKRAAPRS